MELVATPEDAKAAVDFIDIPVLHFFYFGLFSSSSFRPPPPRKNLRCCEKLKILPPRPAGRALTAAHHFA